MWNSSLKRPFDSKPGQLKIRASGQRGSYLQGIDWEGLGVSVARVSQYPETFENRM